MIRGSIVAVVVDAADDENNNNMMMLQLLLMLLMTMAITMTMIYKLLLFYTSCREMVTLRGCKPYTDYIRIQPTSNDNEHGH